MLNPHQARGVGPLGQRVKSSWVSIPESSEGQSWQPLLLAFTPHLWHPAQSTPEQIQRPLPCLGSLDSNDTCTLGPSDQK